MTKEDLILQRCDNLAASVKVISEQVTLCRVEIGSLKVKAGIWGALAGLIPVVIGLGMYVLSVR